MEQYEEVAELHVEEGCHIQQKGQLHELEDLQCRCGDELYELDHPLEQVVALKLAIM